MHGYFGVLSPLRNSVVLLRYVKVLITFISLFFFKNFVVLINIQVYPIIL